ncbi:MAG: phytanoyl-CoA dioxygenase [Rhodospirillaceae bacterium]|nr:phytanoyl-CoA dioxygenase [Rhodospirillaceae bacterium]MBT4487851.1 phytanoyl-CoA dioxygenase [Rhodospirillaceae bacterium]MBT5195653.1 phytanoyl-CoA dioxygenase [Rhodospirillaceae bacterium]MBT5895419.1 phytanoyl-CoA dioxygenase [Rhodospirillaceae bacterium]MBT6428909.1 phytanoyl-CoA dioxygenase [Rhodospirillaceae bacterium]
MLDLSALGQRFREDGVIKLDAVLDQDFLDGARACYDWSLSHKGPHGKGGGWLNEGSDSFEDKANPDAPTVYEALLRNGPLADLAAELWGAEETWFMYEQVFRKTGACRRTPWHQDSSYLAVDGEHLIVFWISFAAVPKAEALEFVSGSHHGPLYNGSTFKIDDPTQPIYPEDELPRLPDIDRAPADWDIVSWDVEPGDVLAFHPKVLHGGGATTHAMRETVSLRFFGPDTIYASRPGPCGPRIAGLHDRLNDGDAFRHPAFLKLR